MSAECNKNSVCFFFPFSSPKPFHLNISDLILSSTNSAITQIKSGNISGLHIVFEVFALELCKSDFYVIVAAACHFSCCCFRV
ncbi:hypothetical protein Hanom_Chr17g01561241 [Helianthus anomalus]